MTSILSILPKDEGFSPARFGAIALCVRDFTLHSRYRAATFVTSGIASDGYEGIRFIPAPPARWYENRTRAYARHCRALIRREQITLAEIHNRPQIVSLLAGKVGCALVLHLHNDPQDMRDARTPAERRVLLERCAAMYCVSDYIRSRFLEGVEDSAGKVQVIPNGIALPDAMPTKEKLIVFAGRLTEGKGALLLAQALAACLPALPQWHAVLIGSDRHSPSEQMTAREAAVIAALAPVSSQAQLAGFLPHEQVMDYFARAAIAVVPSLWQEPFGRTAIEAMAQGCALISSGRGALREVTGDAALTLHTLDVPTLAGAMHALAQEDALRQRYQQQARQRAQQFAIANCAARLDKLRDEIFLHTKMDAA